MNWDKAVSVRSVDSGSSPVRYGCMGNCNKAYPREELKVSDGRVFCASCHPTIVPAHGVKAPHVRGPKPEWRKR